MRAQIRWSADDHTMPPGPSAVPSNLWRPAPGLIPATGDVVFLHSEPGDHLGQGQDHTYTADNARLELMTSGAGAYVRIYASDWWIGTLHPMYSQARLVPGYYEQINTTARYGSARWAATFDCGTPHGWFVVDDVSYAGDTLTSLTARFKLSCAGPGMIGDGSLYGYVRLTGPPS